MEALQTVKRRVRASLELVGTVDQWAQRAGIALVVGPVVFVVVMLVEQTLRPGFSVLSNTISDLGVDTNGWSYAWMFSASIIILGLLTLVAAYALTQVLGRSSRNGAIPLGLAGVGYVGVGIFNDAAYFLEHSIFALDQFVASMLAILILARVFSRDIRLEALLRQLLLAMRTHLPSLPSPLPGRHRRPSIQRSR